MVGHVKKQKNCYENDKGFFGTKKYAFLSLNSCFKHEKLYSGCANHDDIY